MQLQVLELCVSVLDASAYTGKRSTPASKQFQLCWWSLRSVGVVFVNVALMFHEALFTKLPTKTKKKKRSSWNEEILGRPHLM